MKGKSPENNTENNISDIEAVLTSRSSTIFPTKVENYLGSENRRADTTEKLVTDAMNQPYIENITKHISSFNKKGLISEVTNFIDFIVKGQIDIEVKKTLQQDRRKKWPVKPEKKDPKKMNAFIERRKKLIQSTTFYKETVAPYIAYMKNLDAQDGPYKVTSLYEVGFFNTLHKTLLGMVLQVKNEHRKSIVLILKFLTKDISENLARRNKSQKKIKRLPKNKILTKQDIDNIISGFDIEEITIQNTGSGSRKRHGLGFLGKEFIEKDPPFSKLKAFFNSYQALNTGYDGEISGKIFRIIYGNELIQQATYISFYIKELNGIHVDKTLFLFEPDYATGGEPNRSTLVLPGEIFRKDIEVHEGSFNELIEEHNGVKVNQTTNQERRVKRINDTLLEPEPERIMKNSSLLKTIYQYSDDKFQRFVAPHVIKKNTGIKRREELVKIFTTDTYDGIKNPGSPPYALNLKRLTNNKTYSLEAHKINKFLIERIGDDAPQLSLEYDRFKELINTHHGEKVLPDGIVMHESYMTYILNSMRPASDEDFGDILSESLEKNTLTKELLIKCIKNKSNNWTNRSKKINLDERLTEKFGFLIISHSYFLKQLRMMFEHKEKHSQNEGLYKLLQEKEIQTLLSI